MGFGPFSSESTSKQYTTAVTDQAILQGKGAVFTAPNSTAQNFTKAQLASNYKLGKAASLTINQGVSPEDLESILAGVTAATGNQSAQGAAISADALDKLLKLSQQKTDLTAQSTETAAGNPKTLAYVAVAAIAAFALISYFKK